MSYFKIRHARLVEIHSLLEKEDFSFLIEHATPVAREVLDDGTGFLVPDDLSEFDDAIQEYINGTYVCTYILKRCVVRCYDRI